MKPQIWADEFGSLDELTLSFDWNESHSDWRLEELEPLIRESNVILKRYDKEIISCDYISDLIDIDKKYNSLLFDQELSSDDIVTLLRNIENLNITYDTLSMDSSFEYDCIIERISDIFDLYLDSTTIFYSEDEWEINPQAYFDNLQKSRYGLGDRWSINFTIDSIIMPDGKEIKYFSKVGLVGEVFDEVTSNDYCYYKDNISYIAQALSKYSDHQLELLRSISQEVSNTSDFSFPTEEFLRFFPSEIEKLNSEKEMLEHFSVFLPEWIGSDLELLRASLTL